MTSLMHDAGYGHDALDTLADGMHLADLGMLGRQRTGRYHACDWLLVPIGMCSRSSMHVHYALNPVWSGSQRGPAGHTRMRG